MSETPSPDAEDTISVPLPDVPAEEADHPEFEMADVVSALEAVGRTLATLTTQFERLRVMVEGEEGAVTHAPPVTAMGPTPCCGRPVLDIPMNERISFDGAGITCKGATG